MCIRDSTNIVPIFGVGEDDGRGYYVMQFIKGLALDEVLKELKRIMGDTGSGDAAPAGEERIARHESAAANVAHSLMANSFSQHALDDSAYSKIDPTIVPGTRAIPSSANDTPSSGLTSDTLSAADLSVVLPGSGDGRHDKNSKNWSYWQSVARIGVQVAEALEYAHGHRGGVLEQVVCPGKRVGIVGVGRAPDR